MAGYLSESDFVMVEEGFSTQDLLEELTLGASQATTDKATAFFVADLGAIVRKHFCFLKCLPRVRPFYAVKCNSSPGVLKVLAQLGLGFSCANKAEMELVQHIGIPASKIIYANPCKQIAQIKYAAKHGIQLLSFDNEMELAKVVKSHPSANLKALTDVETDLEELELPQESRLSLKFGVPLKSCRHLLESAKKSHVEVVGVSFHVGSGCPDPQAYAQSIADARLVFEMGTELGHRMHVLDLGGGFPGTEGAKVRFEEIASVINSALDLYFPEGCGVDILAELGRYYVTSAFTVAVSIIAKKEVLLDQPGREEENGSAPKTIVYHLDEGVYGIFNSVLFDNICPTPILQKRRRLAVLPRLVSNWAQAIISPRPPKKLGLQVCVTTSGLGVFNKGRRKRDWAHSPALQDARGFRRVPGTASTSTQSRKGEMALSLTQGPAQILALSHEGVGSAPFNFTEAPPSSPPCPCHSRFGSAKPGFHCTPEAPPVFPSWPRPSKPPFHLCRPRLPRPGDTYFGLRQLSLEQL
ncbi:antizyme inhibitor 2 isoform X2 [Aotus nancymaae]|uniref:antizyme inhibitor 2 isoform X2 n=1 Tax=Aotus nancymaae TaxID=37293 RepID=UPI0030FEA4DD